jgi:predicted acylesterase/phospholipase RssA
MTVPHPAADPLPQIGEAGLPVRALVLGGGAYDTVMQLGVTHALLVARLRPPEIVVGVSAGAINAAALAEILQAGSSPDNPAPNLEARVARFREVLEAYRKSPEDVIAPLLPDIYQVDARAPLVPTKLPIHKTAERNQRFEAARARQGLIDLANDVFRIQLSVGAMARLVRAGLGWVAAGDVTPWWKKWAARLVELWRVYRTLAANPRALAPLAAKLVSVVVGGQVHRFASWLASATVVENIGLFLQGLVPALQRTRWTGGAVTWIATRLSERTFGSTAASIMFRGWVGDATAGLVRGTAGWTVLLSVLSLPLTAPVMIASLLGTFAPFARGWLATESAGLHLVPGAEMILHFLTPGQWAIVAAGLLAAAVLLFVSAKQVGIDKLLDHYSIADGVFDPHSLRSWLVRLFDPAYYGPTSMDDVVDAALSPRQVDDTEIANRTVAKPRVIDAYDSALPPIHVGVMAADLGAGKLGVIDGASPLVEALVAANAIPPLFEAQEVGGQWVVDGSVVANEPIRALLSHLRQRVNPAASGVQVFTASPMPAAERSSGDSEAPAPIGAVQVARRSMHLQRRRDAELDRRMTDLLSRSMPGSDAVWQGRTKAFIRATVHPIELSVSVHRTLTERVLMARTVTEGRTAVAQAVADGCRATMETLLTRNYPRPSGVADAVRCSDVVERSLGRGAMLPLPGTGVGDGPGLPEVCSECALNRASRDNRGACMLRRPGAPTTIPEWPLESQTPPQEEDATSDEPEQVSSKPSLGPFENATRKRTWPATKRDLTGADLPNSRPTVSLLFSGGVFRGVYLAGVLNALNEMSVEPDIIAGSSIGSITAAMAARIFAVPRANARERQARVVRMAATYLALDRLVLTDRFADFIRNLTIRAGATEFSPRDFDTVFRSFDRPSTDQYGSEFRKVLAGIERLLWVSPFEARELAEALRLRDYERAESLVESYAQEWLERAAVGLEVLGAEPLELLVRQHVLDGPSSGGSLVSEDAFAKLLRNGGIQFMATATNLNTASLETLYFPKVRPTDPSVRLIEALLASSAFPGVFRPRWKWEVEPETETVHQYIDGGVMDNLPLDAVARFLNYARHAGRVEARPRSGGVSVPHLLFTASLEIAQAPVTDPASIARVASRWRSARKRAKQLTYNTKIEAYEKAQRALREMHEASLAAALGSAAESANASQFNATFPAMDMEVVAVRPAWLCGTFAFHPMLGFRREDQAKSIAHGCRTTFQTLAATPQVSREAWRLQGPGQLADTSQPNGKVAGHCWYRPDQVCPFSRANLDEQHKSLGDHTREAVARIHHVCGKEKTHKPRAD